MDWVDYWPLLGLVMVISGLSREWTQYRTRRAIAAHITARMKTVSPSLSAAQALDDLRMAVESGDYEATP